MEKILKEQRQDYAKYQLRIAKRVRSLYRSTGEDLSYIIRKIRTKGRIEKAIKLTMKQLAKDFEKMFDDTIMEYQKNDDEHDIELIKYLFGDRVTGEIDKKDVEIDIKKLREEYLKVNIANLKELKKRRLKDGKILSDRVWNMAEDNEEKVLGMLEDVYTNKTPWTKFATDVQKYMGDKKAYWKGERLVRTELANINAERIYNKGKANPGYKGIEWKLSGNHSIRMPMGDICDDYADLQYFKQGNEPAVPHPNCMCWQKQWLYSKKEFENILDNWEDGTGYVPKSVGSKLDKLIGGYNGYT